MNTIVKDAKADAAKNGIKCRISQETLTYFDFLERYRGSAAPTAEPGARRRSHNHWQQGDTCAVNSSSGGGWCVGRVAETGRDPKTGEPNVTVRYEVPSGETLEKVLPHDSAAVRQGSSVPQLSALVRRR